MRLKFTAYRIGRHLKSKGAMKVTPIGGDTSICLVQVTCLIFKKLFNKLEFCPECQQHTESDPFYHKNHILINLTLLVDPS